MSIFPKVPKPTFEEALLAQGRKLTKEGEKFYGGLSGFLAGGFGAMMLGNVPEDGGKELSSALRGMTTLIHPPAPTVSQISMQAMLVGREERRRLRGRTGRAGTITTPGFMAPVQIKKRGLKTKFG